MDNFLSKASSFLNSEPEHPAAPPNKDKDEEPRNPPRSSGYGDLLAGAQSLMQGSPKPAAEDSPHKSPSSTNNYGDLLAGAQALMAGGATKPKPKGDGTSMDGEARKSSGSGGFGDIFAGAQAISGSMKPGGGDGVGGDVAPISRDEDEDEDAHKKSKSGYGDVLANAQVLMKAAKVSGEADMGEVAGAAENLIGAAAKYGDLEKRGYGEYANKAQTYLHDYQVSHSKLPSASVHPSPSPKEGSAVISEEDYKPSISKAPLKPAREDDGERE